MKRIDNKQAAVTRRGGNPVKAPIGQSVLQNAAHASDSVQRATHERKIIGLYDNAGDDCARIITKWLKDS